MGDDQATELKPVFEASLRRCLAKPEFLMYFYELFLDSSDEVRAKFEGTDFARQKQVLRDSFFVLEMLSESTPGSPAWSAVQRLAVTHDRHHRDIRPEHYDLWLDCLLRSVAEHDPEYTEEVGRAWRESLRTGIDYLVSKY